ncbi:L-ascorbate metabolism protein UlaG, beta-lactamase superfamily [Nakamurella panacisegetis]|uniref:L-ascorbate metabolism protein UlaG, beta-lactamase superfamily n=1 Tax=Nakamurella panacisegetis TaxID=1090615 RepID=A0A1H0T8M7_9ACTN|nr:MBL fold metallo-hydrolase [Nakamurella panacisegetis]SDP50374.1 L-ascorbate metabolism protein UlaG, beta-lactamase superfamily [Nakamurella panacisegetis]
MQITKLGHSCLHVVDGDANLLVDPGVFSSGFENLTGLTGILITHEHLDHLDLDRLPALVAANPQAGLYADHGSAATLRSAGLAATAVAAGDSFDVGTPVTVHGDQHAVIYPEIPTITNASYLIGGRLLHPGDALDVFDLDVEILALPTAAPWMALKESVDYYRAVMPKVAFPIHEGILANPAMFYGIQEKFGPADATWVVPTQGESFEA